MLEVQIWQFPLSKRGQGGFFTTKTIYTYRTCIHADTPKKVYDYWKLIGYQAANKFNFSWFGIADRFGRPWNYCINPIARKESILLQQLIIGDAL